MAAFDPGPPPPSDFTVRLGAAQIEAFHRDGFTHVERITTDEELAWLEPIHDSLFENRRGAWRGGYFDLARPYESDGQDLVPQVLAPEHFGSRSCATPRCCAMRSRSAPSCSASTPPTCAPGAT